MNHLNNENVVDDEDEKCEITHRVAITLEEEPYIMIMQYAHEFSPNECSGVGLVSKTKNNDGSIDFNVTKVFLPLQRNSPGGTNIDDNELNKLNTQLVIDGIDTKLFRFHWHSHVDMSVFHSGTDRENYDDMGTGEWAVSLVVNKRYDMLGSVHLYDPLRINILNIEVEPPDSVDLDTYVIPKKLRKIIEEKANIVQAWDEEQSAKEQASRHLGRGGVSNTVYPNQVGYCIDDLDYMQSGLCFNQCLYSLMQQGEKAGLLHLKYDIDQRTIVGYQDLTTNECFVLGSEEDYTNYNPAMGGQKQNEFDY